MPTRASTAAPKASLYERLAMRETIPARLNVLKTELIEAVNAHTQFQRELSELSAEINGYLENGQLVDPRNETRLNKARAQETQLRGQAASAGQRHIGLNNEIIALEKSMASSRDGGTTGLEDVLAYQRDLREARDEIDHIQSLIDGQHAILSSTEQPLSFSGELQSQREVLAAEVALGKANESLLQELDQKIIQEKQEHERAANEKRPIIDRSHQTIAGLERKMAEANQKLNALEKMSTDVYSAFLFTLAEAEAQEYLDLAEQLIHKYLRLTAIEHHLKRVDSGLSFSSRDHQDMFIPNLSLKACEGRGYKDAPWKLFVADRARSLIEDETKKFSGEMRKLGVEF